MPYNLSTRTADFEAQFSALLNVTRESQADVTDKVADIIADIVEHGDSAVLRLTKEFDHTSAQTIDDLRLNKDALRKAYNRIEDEVRSALHDAADRITAFHKKQIPADIRYTDEAGIELSLRHTPVESAGMYVPGGKASYPSSVLMNAMPAKVAGVGRLVMTTPATQDDISDMVLAAAHIAEITEVWAIGGAQAIAALAYGTESIQPVDKIVGPGNAFVAAAKRQVFGKVGIDSIAGPSEILVLADSSNNPDWIALDILSQAEHDEAAQAILITNDVDFAKEVEASIDSILPTLERKDIAGASWQNHGAVITVENWDEGAALANRIAPEHLEIMTQQPERLAEKIHHAGAIFLGPWTPEAIGDYIAGPNHVLPTARTARFSSGLGVLDFMKRTTMVHCDSSGLSAIGQAGATLAKAEGLEAHALSILRRMNK